MPGEYRGQFKKGAAAALPAGKLAPAGQSEPSVVGISVLGHRGRLPLGRAKWEQGGQWDLLDLKYKYEDPLLKNNNNIYTYRINSEMAVA